MKTTFKDNKAYIFEEKKIETTVPVTTYVTKTEIKEVQTDVINLNDSSSYRGTIWKFPFGSKTYEVLLVTCGDKIHFIDIGNKDDFYTFNWAIEGCDFGKLAEKLSSLKAVYIGRVNITIK